MPSPNQTKTSLGMLIKSSPPQAFFYERNDLINEREVGDIWLYLPYVKEEIYLYTKVPDKKDQTTYWENVTFDTLTPEMKVLLTLLF